MKVTYDKFWGWPWVYFVRRRYGTFFWIGPFEFAWEKK